MTLCSGSGLAQQLGAWAAGSSSNAIHPWQQRRAPMLLLQATELPASFHILSLTCDSHQVKDLQRKCCLIFPTLSLKFSVHLPSLFSAPSSCSLTSLILPSSQDSRAKAVPVLEDDNGCQDPAVRGAVNSKAAGSSG